MGVRCEPHFVLLLPLSRQNSQLQEKIIGMYYYFEGGGSPVFSTGRLQSVQCSLEERATSTIRASRRYSSYYQYYYSHPAERRSFQLSSINQKKSPTSTHIFEGILGSKNLRSNVLLATSRMILTQQQVMRTLVPRYQKQNRPSTNLEDLSGGT